MARNKGKVKIMVFTLIGVLFTVYGAILCLMSNLNLGVLLVSVFGIVALCVGAFYRKIETLLAPKVFRWLKILFGLLFCAELVLTSFIAIYGFSDNVDYQEDAVIVLGAGVRGDRVTLPLKMRLDKAIAYHEKNPDAVLIVTGGQGFQETVTEAYAMKKYLMENGVDEEKIIKEEKATSTEENMKFSKEILDTYFDEDYSVAVITNHFHVFRGTALARRTGFVNVSHMHAGLQWYNVLPCFLRESLAVMKMFVFD